MKFIIAFGFSFCLNACTLSFTNVMTSGSAEDVVDSTPHTDSTVSPNVSIPASIL